MALQKFEGLAAIDAGIVSASGLRCFGLTCIGGEVGGRDATGVNLSSSLLLERLSLHPKVPCSLL